MTPEKLAELEAATAAAKKAAEDAGGADETLNKTLADAQAALQAANAPSQDPVDKEIEREKGKKQRTEAEKAEYALKNNFARAKELGLDPAKVLGLSTETAADADDDDRPMTVGEFKKFQTVGATKTAKELAASIEDTKERELVIHYLDSISNPDPNEALRLARLAANSVKNGQIAEELGRNNGARSYGTGAGAPAKQDDGANFVPTSDEAQLMRPPFNLSKEDVLKARRSYA